jgi:GGDEF domain-containing protein
MLMNFGKGSALVKEIGEAALEEMMQSVGQAVCTHIRQNDVAIRYDRTSIALLLADTNEKSAFFVVDKMRKVLGDARVPGTDRAVQMTAGISEALIQAKYDAVDIVTEVINRVESALETALANGVSSAHALPANVQLAEAT